MNVLSMFVLNLFHAKLKVTHCGILNGMKAMQKVQHKKKKQKQKTVRVAMILIASCL